MKRFAICVPAAMFAGACWGIVVPAEPGAWYCLDSSWREIQIPRASFVHPFIVARTRSGKVVYSGAAGAFNQRAYSPNDLTVQRWRSYARVATPTGTCEATELYGVSAATLSSVTLPEDTAEIELKLVCEGEPAKWTNENLCVSRLYGKEFRHKMSSPRMQDEVPTLDDDAIDAALAVRGKERLAFSAAAGRTSVLLDGREIVPRIYKMSSRDVDRYKIPAVFSACGFNLFACPIEVSRFFASDGPERLASELRKYLRHAPTARLLLNLNITPPPKWGENHPSEIFRNPAGQYGLFHHTRIIAFTDSPDGDADWCERRRMPAVSYCSRVFADYMSENLVRLFAELEKRMESKSVVGVYLSGGCDGQWYDLFDQNAESHLSADYSVCALDAYRRHLKDKYGTADRLAEAWGVETSLDFCKIEIPRSDAFWIDRTYFREHGETPEGDYREMLAESTASMLRGWAGAIKQGSSGRLVVGGYCSNAGLHGYPKLSLSCMKRMFLAPEYDFFAVVPSYSREYSDPVITSAFAASISRRGKLYIGEMDLRNPDVANWGSWGGDFWRANHTAETYRRTVLKFALDAVVKGGGYHGYDMDGGWFTSAAARETWRVAAEITDQAKVTPLDDNRIAFIAAEDYYRQTSFGGDGRMLAYSLRDNPQRAFALCGVPVDVYLIDDVIDDETRSLPKVVVFGDMTTVSPERFAKLHRRCCRDGRVVVYQWRLGLFASGGQAEEASLGLVQSGMKGNCVFAEGTSCDALMRGIKGRMFASYAPWGAPDVEGLVPVSGSDWKELAKLDGTDAGGLFVRRGTLCTEVYIAHPASLTSQFCRNLAREAGFEPLVESDELSGCGSGIFYMVAQSSGPKQFRLPSGNVPIKVLYGPPMRHIDDVRFTVDMKIGEIFVLSYK